MRLANFRIGQFLGSSLLFILLLSIACGSAAEPPATSAPGASATQAPAAGETGAPTAVAEPTTEPAAPSEPAGTLTVGQKEIGGYDGHPKLVVNPALFVSQTAPLGEGLFYSDIDREIQPWLVESWSISEDFTAWTFKIREGVSSTKATGR
jgi:ABC-type transport system substrate-binding protein